MRPAGSRQMTRLAEVCVLLVHWHHHPGGPEPTLRVAVSDTVGSCRVRRVRMSRKPQRWSSLRSGPSPAPSRATDGGCTSLAGDLNRNTLTNLKRDGTWHVSFTGKTTLAAQAPRTLLSETTGTPRAPAERMMARSFWPVPTCKPARSPNAFPWKGARRVPSSKRRSKLGGISCRTKIPRRATCVMLSMLCDSVCVCVRVGMRGCGCACVRVYVWCRAPC